MNLLQHDTLLKNTQKRKMAGKRPRFGEIGRESCKKDEESVRNPKKTLPGPENGIQGVFFCTFRSLLTWALFRNFAGSPNRYVSRPFRPCIFVYILRVSLFRPPIVSAIWPQVPQSHPRGKSGTDARRLCFGKCLGSTEKQTPEQGHAPARACTPALG